MQKYHVNISSTNEFIQHTFWKDSDEEAVKLCKIHKGCSEITLSRFVNKEGDHDSEKVFIATI